MTRRGVSSGYTPPPRGFAQDTLVTFVAVVGIFIAIALSLSVAVRARARAVKVQADVRTLDTAIRMYSTTFGTLPAELVDLTRAQTPSKVRGGPILRAIPVPPTGWSPYSYTGDSAGTYAITTSYRSAWHSIGTYTVARRGRTAVVLTLQPTDQAIAFLRDEWTMGLPPEP